MANSTDLKKDKECSRWSELFPEIFQLISTKAFRDDPGSIGAMRTVCKSWNSMSKSNPLLVRNSLPEYPYVMAILGRLCMFYHSFSGHSFKMEFPELSKATVYFAKLNWLIAFVYGGYVEKDYYFFFNPFTKESIEIPISVVAPEHRIYRSMCCNETPTSPNCYVIGVQENGLAYCSMSNGETGWLSFRTYGHFRTAYCHPVFYGSNCYILGYKGNVGVFNVQTRGFHIHEAKLTEGQIDRFDRTYLLENEGELLALLVNDDTQAANNVVVKALDPNEGVWRPIQSLRNKMVYVSPTSSFVRLAPVRSMSNKLFFTDLKNGSCLFYSLDTRTYHTFFGDYWSVKRSAYNLKWASAAGIWIDLLPFEDSNESIPLASAVWIDLMPFEHSNEAIP